jgi:transposase-like protein
MDFAIGHLLDEDACYAWLVRVLHPDGLACPRCSGRDLKVHRRHRAPVLDHRCVGCGRVFNAFTGTALHATRFRPSEIVLILRGFAKGATTAGLARELGRNRPHLQALRHRLQAAASAHRDAEPLPDREAEADEMYQMAGEKGVPHIDPADPPRRRGGRPKGCGTWKNDRPPIIGVVGREFGQVRLVVAPSSREQYAIPAVRAATTPRATILTDEWPAYARLTWDGYGHATVSHKRREWARDDDGDGIREVHDNTMEGIWTGLRNFLRRFRGVSKRHLAKYVAMFEWSYNLKSVTDRFLRALLTPMKPLTTSRT